MKPSLVLLIFLNLFDFDLKLGSGGGAYGAYGSYSLGRTSAYG